MKDTIGIQDIFKVLKKRWKLIVLITFFAAILSGVISYFIITPKYQASTQILVNQRNSENQIDMSQLKSNIDLINTYSVIIKSPIILEKVIENLDLTQNVDQLNQNIKVSSQDNSQVFSVTVEESSAIAAVNIANSISEIFQREIKGIMNVDNVNILAKAVLKDNPTPVSPNTVFNIAIAVVAGMMSGVGMALLIEMLDTTVKEGQDVEILLGLPVLGSIQKIPSKGFKRGSKNYYLGSGTLESKVEAEG